MCHVETVASFLAGPLPKYRHYKPKTLGVVRLNGQDVYLGRYNSPESLEKYGRVIAEWRASGSVAAPAASSPAAQGDDDGLTVVEVILAFIRPAETYYRRADGSHTEEFAAYKRTVQPLRKLYGSTPAKDFGPQKLKAVRQNLMDSGICRKTINQRIRRLVHLFAWAVAEELVPPNIHHGLKALKGLQKGRSKAGESDPVKPVTDADVDAVRPHVSRQLWAMIELRRLIGMWPGEVCVMRTADIDRTGRIWLYAPADHKTAHHDHGREIYIGPKAEAILSPWFVGQPADYLFSPRRAMAEKSAADRQARKTPMTPSQRARKKRRKPKRSPGDCYLVRSYAHAIRRACKAANVGHWHPHQLRHNAATYLRKEFGLDVARVILGRRSSTVTEVYAEVDRSKAKLVMERVG